MTMTEPAKLNRKERRAQRKIVTEAIENNRPISLVASLTASAATVRVATQWQNMKWGGTDWQSELWSHYDTCPEFGAGVELVSSALSRARLIGVKVDETTGEPGTQPADDADVQGVMSLLFGGPSGQSQALAAIGKHVQVAGDLFVLATDQPDTDQTSWEILGTTEVTATGSGSIHVLQMNGQQREIDTDEELLFRIWRPHPAHRWNADSAARRLLPVLRELAALTAMVSATVKSRLASAGILWLPEEISAPAPMPTDVVVQTQVLTETTVANEWLDLITEAMTAPIADPDSAAAVVPLVATVKGDLIAKISHMEFGRDLDGAISQLRQDGVARLAVGMSLPAEYLNGQGDINHWTGWLIAEDFNRFYLAPILELIADALTRFYLRPALRARGIDPSAYAVYFDLGKLLPQQINTDNATAAYQAGLLSEVEYMAALGFAPAQMALPAERGRRLLLTLAATQPDALSSLAAVLTQVFPGAPVVDVPAIEAPIRQSAAVTPAQVAKETAPDPAGGPAAPAAVGGPPNGGAAPAPPTPNAPPAVTP